MQHCLEGIIGTKRLEDGVKLQIFKRGDQKDSNNYYGIFFLSTGAKIYEQVLEKKLKYYNIIVEFAKRFP